MWLVRAFHSHRENSAYYVKMQSETKTKRGLSMEIVNVNGHASAYRLSYEEDVSKLSWLEHRLSEV